MIYILLIIVLLWALWHVCNSLVASIQDKIENNAIQKSSLKEDLQTTTLFINNSIDKELVQIRSSVSSFIELTYKSLPGLKERIDRDKRKQEFIKNVLPYKKNNRNKRKRR